MQLLKYRALQRSVLLQSTCPEVLNCSDHVPHSKFDFFFQQHLQFWSSFVLNAKVNVNFCCAICDLIFDENTSQCLVFQSRGTVYMQGYSGPQESVESAAGSCINIQSNLFMFAAHFRVWHNQICFPWLKFPLKSAQKMWKEVHRFLSGHGVVCWRVSLCTCADHMQKSGGIAGVLWWLALQWQEMFPVGPVANILSVSPSLGKEASLICHCDFHTVLSSPVLNIILPWGCCPAVVVFSLTFTYHLY